MISIAKVGFISLLLGCTLMDKPTKRSYISNLPSPLYLPLFGETYQIVYSNNIDAEGKEIICKFFYLQELMSPSGLPCSPVADSQLTKYASLQLIPQRNLHPIVAVAGHGGGSVAVIINFVPGHSASQCKSTA